MCASYTGEGEGESPAVSERPLLALPVFSQAHRCLSRRFATGSFGEDFHPFGLKFCILGTQEEDLLGVAELEHVFDFWFVSCGRWDRAHLEAGQRDSPRPFQVLQNNGKFVFKVKVKFLTQQNKEHFITFKSYSLHIQYF